MTDAEAIQQKLNVSEATKRRNPHLFVNPAPEQNAPAEVKAAYLESGKRAKPKKRLRQSSKPLMNKLESEFYEGIRNMGGVRIQAKRYRLGNGIWYKPDFTISGNFSDGKFEIAYEVKGPHAFRGGFENLKVAASQWPEVRFILVWKDKATGQWQTQEILA